MRVVLPGAADAAEHLDAVFDVGLGGDDTDAGGQRRGNTELTLVRLAGRPGRVGRGHLGLLGTTQHLRTQVLDGLEAADRLAELFAHLGIGDRGVQGPPGHAGRLGRQHRRGQVLDAFGRHRNDGGRRRRQHHPGQRPGKVGGPQWLDLHAVAIGVDQQPVLTRRQQQEAAVGTAQRPGNGARRLRSRSIELHVPLESQPGELLARRQRGQHLGIIDDQRGQRGRRDRPGHQRLGSLLDHGAQVLDAAAGPAAVLGNSNAEQPQIGQAPVDRPPRVGLPLFDSASRLARIRTPGPIAHQFTRRELFVGDGRYHQ